jgi:glycosyltransferase involved in cell wall biosynthesis
MGVGNLVIAVSNAVGEKMRQKGVPAAKLRVVHNGTINGARRSAVPQEVLTLARPAVVTVAGLHPRKGVDTLIEAIAQVRASGLDVHLYVVGGGPQYAALERLAQDTGHGDAIHLMGYISDPRTVLAGSDVFVLASLAEPCGLALIEARQMGCACIASNVDGNPEILDFGKSGRLFAPGESAELASVLRGVLTDKDELLRLRLAARSGWQYWTVERMARETLDVYDEALVFPRRPARLHVPEQA